MRKISCLVCQQNTNRTLCFYNFFVDQDLCCHCYNQIIYKPRFINYKQHHITILYEYNEVMQQIIHLWKIYDCPKAKKLLWSLVKNYLDPNMLVLFPPSWKKEKTKSQIEMLLNYGKRKNINAFCKKFAYNTKQLPLAKKHASFILAKKISEPFFLFDDIYASGKTIRKCLDLLGQQHDFKIKSIIIASSKKA